MRWWLLALVLVGCVDSDLVECADARLCPRGTACDVAHHSCVAPDQLTACDGLADLTSCQTQAIELGRCFAGVCLPAGCGNGEREPEELCDDGNLVGGDGCSADCRSREVCGDGFTDTGRGELCDDGNTRSRDGCTNRCTPELPVWHQHLVQQPPGRTDAGGAYDPLAGELVVFGGSDAASNVLDDTWGLGEAGWTSLTAPAPAPRVSPALTYDPHTHRVLMFGGYSGPAQSLLYADTWEWNGAVWTRRTSPTVPPARLRAAMASDGTHVILFGGSRLGDVLGDTWSWDGQGWTRLAPAHAPPMRDSHAMVFDPKHGRIVLFGGKASTGLTDTWVFDGSDWSRLTTAMSPPLTTWAALAYDAKREVVVLSAVDAVTTNNIVWELDGASWQPKSFDTSPNISGGAVLGYDERRQRVVQTLGKRAVTGQLRADVWEWDGTDWMLRMPPPQPEARVRCALASDPLRGRVVLFGGQGAQQSLADTWEWDGWRWRATTSLLPAARARTSMVFDGAAGELLLFGGAGQSVFGDTWHYNGVRWQAVNSAGPPARYGHAMVYDSKRSRVLLFGGTNGTDAFDDTWQFDGTTWTLIATSGPPRRVFTQLAYDAARDRVVMFGGESFDGTTRLADTWEFDGTTWSERTPFVGPESRAGYSLVYDRMRGRVMLFGGLVSTFSLWEWDGSEWTQPETTSVPAASNYACATYDDARGELITFGGGQPAPLPDTWTGSYRGERDEVCRAGADLDADGASGCDDDDCRTVCAPLCWDDPTCTLAPRCGDGTCSSLESDAGAACASDCL
jgi:cysteine-rich repeat protein